MASRIWSRTVASADFWLSRQVSDCVSGKEEVCPIYQPLGLLLVVEAESTLLMCAGPSGLCCSVSRSCLTVCHPLNCSTPGFRNLLKLVSFESVMPSNLLILCRPPLLLSSVFPSIRVFSSELALRIRWPKCWSFSFIISPSNDYLRLISFRIDWFNLLAVQGILKSLL